MKIFGITGPTGAGKSLLCQELAKHLPIIDADEVYHSLLLPPSDCLTALRNTFGDSIFLPNGSLDRTALSAIVFSEEEKLALLNRTVLDFVLQKIRAIIAQLETTGQSAVAVDGPTLIESGFYKECDIVISVLASPTLRLSRIMARDSLSEEKAVLRMKAQPNDDFYRTNSDLILVNNGNPDEFFDKVRALIDTLL